MTPLKPVAPGRKALLGIAFFVLFVAVWAAATLGGFVSRTFLADPVTMLIAGGTLTVIAMIAACFPAMRAAKVDPLVALRVE